MPEFERIKHTPLFKKQLKDYHKNEQAIIDAHIREEIRKNPFQWEDLMGDVLKGCKSFPVSNKIPGNHRIIYRIVNAESEDRMIRLIAVGPHRNIYEIASRYLQETGLVIDPDQR